MSSPAPAQPAAPVQAQPPYQAYTITTPQFGGEWGTLPLQNSCSVTIPSITTPESYKQLIQSRLGFHVVEIIKNEVISAASDATQGGAHILLHCVVGQGGQLTFTIKTSSQVTLNNL